MMKQRKIQKLPPPMETFIRAVNGRDRDLFLSTFAHDAVVSDVGQEFRGPAAIKEWSAREIFDVNVTLDVVEVADREGEIVVTVKVDGTFDKTGLPDPLLLNHHFKLQGDKIAGFSNQLASEGK